MARESEAKYRFLSKTNYRLAKLPVADSVSRQIKGADGRDGEWKTRGRITTTIATATTTTEMTNSFILPRNERERERETTIYSNNSGGIGKEKNERQKKNRAIIISPPSAGWGNKNGGFYYGRTSDVSIGSSSLDQGCCRIPFIGINWSEFT